MILFICLLLCILVTYAFFSNAAMNRAILSHGHRRYVEPPFSPSEFYNEVKQQIQAKQIGQVTIDTVNFSEGGLLSANREYLRVRYKEYFFYVCAAPFGTGYFLSWWLGDIGHPIRDILISIPIIGKAFTKKPKTFFEHDTSLMFKETLNDCVNDAILILTNDKGMRGLADNNWNEYNRMYS